MMESAGVKRCLITGAAGSIGEELARWLYADGHELFLVDSNERVDDLAGELSATSVCVDLSTHEGCLRVGRELDHRTDVLINNAARVETVGYTHELSPGAWEADLAVNLTAPFHLSALFVQGMARRGWGRIINIGSQASGGLYRQPAYAASKAGLVGLTKTLALEYAPHGVTSNVVSLGLMSSEKVDQMPSDIRDAALELVPAGLTGPVREVVAAVRHLMSADASYVNGTTIAIDGGAECNQMRMVRPRPAAGPAASSSARS
jgi:D-threitol dehydrogenase (NAD+)